MFQTAAAKGLVAGSFRITRQDGHVIEGINEKEVSMNSLSRGV